MSKFLISGTLRPDLSNLTTSGITQIKSIIGADFVDVTTGKIKNSLLPPIALTSVTVVADIPARDALSVEEGDVVKTSNDNTLYIFDGTTWITITGAANVGDLLDVNISNLQNNDILINNAGTWENSQAVTNHINNSTIHFTEGSINHDNILNNGTNTHAQLDAQNIINIAHIADNTIHFTEGSINHNNILNNGTNTHAQLDAQNILNIAHIADNTIHFTEGSINHDNILNNGTNTHAQLDAQNIINIAHIADNTIHFTEGSINHNNILNNGNYTHAAIDSSIENQLLHVIDNNKHMTLTTKGQIISHDGVNVANLSAGTNAQILTADNTTITGLKWVDPSSGGVTDHTLLTNIGTKTHTEIDTHINDASLHYPQTAIDHTNLLNRGTYTHINIDNHINDATIHQNFSNAAQLQTINQNMASSDNVSFNQININGSTLSTAASRLNINNPITAGNGETQVDVLDFKLAKDGGNSDIKILQRFKEGTNPWYFNGIGIKQFQQFVFYMFASSNFSLRTTSAGDTSDASTNTADRIQFVVDAGGRMNVRSSVTIGHDASGLQPDNGAGLKLSSLSGGIFNQGSLQLSSSSSAWTIASSQKIKREITTHTVDVNCLSSLMSIRVVDFKYLDSEQQRTGIIAEEMQLLPDYNCCISILPTHKMKDCRNGNLETEYTDVPVLNQDKIFWHMLAGVQQLIKERSTPPAVIQSQLDSLSARISAIEAILSI